MDILIPLLLLAVLYLVPELLRRKKNTEYKYPEIPNQQEQSKNMTHAIPALSEKAKVTSLEAKPQDSSINLKPTTISQPSVAAESRIDNTALVNGILWSEILQPPRAYRPLRNIRDFRRE